MALTKKTAISDSNTELNKKLIENFVALQRVMTNLSSKFDNLSDQIAKLLQLFEISAKAIAEKDFETFSKTDNKEVLEKLNGLLEQNKTIARGLTLLHQQNPQEMQIKEISKGYKPMSYQQNHPMKRMLPSENSRLQQRPHSSQNYY